ncbi:MAG: VC0807 family protein [Segniliparus sp.]|uniref:VC0807 family protein n=1 Tax=Segniliparus sp. TaxID=2804064 RepID=UPI003F2DC073
MLVRETLTQWWSHPRFAKARPGLVDGLVPVLLFYLLHSWLGYSEIVALSAGTAFLAARVLATMLRQRRADGFQLFLLGLNIASLALAALSDDPRIVLARQSIVSLATAIGCLSTTFVGKPLLGLLLRPSLDLMSPHHRPAWDLCWDDDAQFRQKIRALNFLIGVTTALTAASRVYVVYHTSTEVAILTAGLPSLAIWALASPLLLRVGRPAFASMRAARLRIEAKALFAEHEQESHYMGR